MLSRKALMFCSLQLVLIFFGGGWLLSAPPPPPALNPETHCDTSGPDSQQYVVEICVVAPEDEAVLTGNHTVSATVAVIGLNPGIRRVIFYLNEDNLLTDYAAPFIFTLPTTYFVDGQYQLMARVLMRDGFESDRGHVNVTFANGITEPPVNPNVFTPAPGTLPQPGQPFVLAAVGDGAGGELRATQVTNLIAGWNPNMLLYLGDVYEKGLHAEFYNWYGLPGGNFYGRFHDITNPAIGNHEYEDNGAPGYFYYWDNVPNYYSFDAAGWHFISLNSTSQFGQTEPDSAQYIWLSQDLAAHPDQCTAVFFHHPIFSVGPQGDATRMNEIWALLADHNVPLVFAAHDHNYQRWLPLNGQGELATGGITQFVVGTGGHGIIPFVRNDPRLAQGFDNAYGALRLELTADQATFQFINVANTVLDAGTVPCHVPPEPTPTPTLEPTQPPNATQTPIIVATPTPTPVPPPQVFTFTAAADTYVSEANPDGKYGTAWVLRTDASPILRSYLRFDVQGLPSAVVSATLRVYANTASRTGYDVHSVGTNDWAETLLTYNTAPLPGAAIGSSGPFGSPAWTTVNVTPLITGNGLVSLVITTINSTATSLASREMEASPPQLVVRTGPSLASVAPNATQQTAASTAENALPTIVVSLAGLQILLLVGMFATRNPQRRSFKRTQPIQDAG